MPRQRWLLDILADEFRGVNGFRVDFYPGWETRGRELFDPTHVMDHHTGPGAYNNLLRYMAVGPVHPPLCNYATSRPHNGIVRITVVAAGRANHAGRGVYATIPRDQGNRYSLGAEHQNDGRQAWPAQQVEAIRRCDAALLKHLNRNVNRMLDHKTYAPVRKVDRHSVNVNRERQEVLKLMSPKPKPKPQLDPWEEFLMSLSDEQREVLETFSEYLVDNGVRGDSFGRQGLHIIRTFGNRLEELFSTLENQMNSSARGLARSAVALWREAGARGWDRDPDKFSKNRNYTSGDLDG